MKLTQVYFYQCTSTQICMLTKVMTTTFDREEVRRVHPTRSRTRIDCEGQGFLVLLLCNNTSSLVLVIREVHMA